MFIYSESVKDSEKVWPKMVRSSSSSEVAVALLAVVDKMLVIDTNLSIIPISNAVATTFEIWLGSDK